MTLINKEELMTDVLVNIRDDSTRELFLAYIQMQHPVHLADDIERIKAHMDQYLMWDLNDLVRISQLGGYQHYGHTIDHTFARLKAVVGFGFTCGLITASDFDNIYWTLVHCQRRMEQEAKQYAESV